MRSWLMVLVFIVNLANRGPAYGGSWPIIAGFDGNGTITAAAWDPNFHHADLVQRVDKDGNIDKHTTFDPQIGVSSSPWYGCSFAFGCVWLAGYGDVNGACVRRVPMKELRFFNPADERSMEVYFKEYRKSEYISHTWRMEPVRQAAWAIFERDGRYGLGTYPRLTFDFLPTGEKSGKLFLLGDKELAVWDTNGKWLPESKTWETSFDKVETLRVPFTNGFHAFATKNDYYFLTSDGILYVAPRKENRRVQPVWNSKDQPIRAAITDIVNKKTYLCGVKRNKQPFFFELADEPKVQYKQHQLVNITDSMSPIEVAEKFIDVMK